MITTEPPSPWVEGGIPKAEEAPAPPLCLRPGRPRCPSAHGLGRGSSPPSARIRRRSQARVTGHCSGGGYTGLQNLARPDFCPPHCSCLSRRKVHTTRDIPLVRSSSILIDAFCGFHSSVPYLVLNCVYFVIENPREYANHSNCHQRKAIRPQEVAVRLFLRGKLLPRLLENSFITLALSLNFCETMSLTTLSEPGCVYDWHRKSEH